MKTTEFISSVKKHITSDYLLENGKEVKGQSLTYLRQCLVIDGFKGISGYRLEDRLVEAGFKVSYGRGKRWYHNGHRGLGVTCQVAHEKEI